VGWEGGSSKAFCAAVQAACEPLQKEVKIQMIHRYVGNSLTQQRPVILY
jgi:hypothetical protein